jgi:hypothetical protein
MTTEEALAAVVKMLQEGVEAAGPLAQEVLRQYQLREGFLGCAQGLGALVWGVVIYLAWPHFLASIKRDDGADVGVPTGAIICFGAVLSPAWMGCAILHFARCIAPLPYILGM